MAVDEPLVELETDKVTIEVPAPAAGVLSDISAKDGETVAVGALLGQIKEGAGAPAAKPAAAPTGRPDQKTSTTTPIGAADEEPRPRVPPKADAEPKSKAPDMPLAPSVRRIAAESGIGPGGRVRDRQGRPRHQGRHDGGDRARRGAADAGRAVRRRDPGARAARRPTMPRARSACA